MSTVTPTILLPFKLPRVRLGEPSGTAHSASSAADRATQSSARDSSHKHGIAKVAAK